MAQHATRKRTAHGKADTLARRQVRRVKHGTTATDLDALRRDLGLAVA